MKELFEPDFSDARRSQRLDSEPTTKGDEFPYDLPRNVWEDLAVGCGLGSGMDPFELELDALRGDFKRAFLDAVTQTDTMDSPSLYSLLNELDPEFTAQTFAPEDDAEMQAIYKTWGARVLSPDEEDDET